MSGNKKTLSRTLGGTETWGFYESLVHNPTCIYCFLVPRERKESSTEKTLHVGTL
jgi:hypothetical protein